VLNPVDGRAFTNEDLDLFIKFSRQVALAIENANIHRYLLEKQKLEQQLEAAYSIQQSFMPQTFPQSSEGAFSVWATNLPAKSIGGDFYDFIEFTPQPKLGIMIGDVSGKGIPAALYMARLVSDLRFYSLSEKTPAACLSAVNNTLATRSRRGMFVTLVYLLLDLESGKLQITNGGHLPPIWYHHTTGQIEMLEHLEGIPLGISRMATFQATEIQLAPGDSLVLFTDGVIEAKNKRGMQFSRTGLIEALHTRWESPKALVTHLIKRVLHFSQGMAQHDDITIVAFTWRPRQP
ncbi:serine/threonine-protein phosphatase, partial [candidate division KSB1 bacterium]|nr:serine/threonine-protein phosphatase [candidate division KSB1 bacterium]